MKANGVKSALTTPNRAKLPVERRKAARRSKAALGEASRFK
jgi:hypothetical protein